MTKIIMIISIVVAIAIVGPLQTWAFSKGAPDAVCGDLTPHHREFKSKTSSPPYYLKFDTAEFTSNKKYKGFIQGTTDQDLLKGFIIQARIGDTPIGHFIPGPNSQTIDCGDAKKSSLTHTKITGNGVNRIDFEWEAPNLSGEVVFRVTFVKSYEEFWAVNQQNSPKYSLKQ